MDSVGSFVSIYKHDLYFNGCSSCDGNCCNGAKGFAIAPLILEDFKEVYKNFKIVFGLNENQVGAYVVLNDGKSHCKYYQDSRCSIYEQRTPACKLYPISPYFENILVDTECPSINSEFGEPICIDKQLNQKFYTDRLKNFNEKLLKTYEFYNSINDATNFEQIGEISGLPIFKYIKRSSNPYIQMHLESLDN